jgi:hypothetical protein
MQIREYRHDASPYHWAGWKSNCTSAATRLCEASV